MRNQLCPLLLLLLLVACSLPPEKPVTRNELMQSRIYNQFIVEESPEEVLDALNRNGEVILDAKRNIPGKDYPVHLKVLATSEGLEVLDYDK
jgi:hypothetical protein